MTRPISSPLLRLLNDTLLVYQSGANSLQPILYIPYMKEIIEIVINTGKTYFRKHGLDLAGFKRVLIRCLMVIFSVVINCL